MLDKKELAELLRTIRPATKVAYWKEVLSFIKEAQGLDEAAARLGIVDGEFLVSLTPEQRQAKQAQVAEFLERSKALKQAIQTRLERLADCVGQVLPSLPLDLRKKALSIQKHFHDPEATADLFAQIYATLIGELAQPPALPASGQAAPAAGKAKRGAKKTKKVSDSEYLIISALATHHRYGQEDINQEPVKVRELAKTLSLSPSVVSDFFKKKFGSYKQYVVCCRSRKNLIVSLKLLQGEYTPRFLLSNDPEQWQNEDFDQYEEREE